MDSDFELECQEIAKRRQEEGNMADNDLPDFICTASNLRKYSIFWKRIMCLVSKSKVYISMTY